MSAKVFYEEITSTITGVSADVVTAPGYNVELNDRFRVSDITGTLVDGDYKADRIVYDVDLTDPDNPISTPLSFRLEGVGSTTNLHTINVQKITTTQNSLGRDIKIGFDKVPAPVTKIFQQLVDIDGTLLFDDANNPLVTEESAALSSLTVSDNALSIQVNNKNKPGGGGSIKIVEQFKETSEVSSSLLGVPRAEEQLSLFSDVATYGLDVDNWDASDLRQGHSDDPPEWYRKDHPIHGRRSNISFNEGSDEQALYLKAFPTQYTFPYGTRYKKLGSATERFKLYMNFIALGRYLYDFWYKDGHTQFAEKNFLAPRFVQIVNSSEQPFGTIEEPAYSFASGGSISTLDFNNFGSFFDVDYLANEQDSYDAIERWTAFYDKIRGGTDQYPQINDLNLIAREGSDRQDRIRDEGYKAFFEYTLIQNMVRDDRALPGNSNTAPYHGILLSKRTFRYQPGRVSGFTFGVRMQSDGAPTSSTVAEWGCSNDTDEYMFQLKGESLSIIRRSTVELPDTWFEREGIPRTSQTLVSLPGVRNDINQDDPNAGKLYQTRILREQFNGDALQGGGLSGYTLSFEDVTMYKIEFSWYGAIGAKFYAYVPVGNGDARWVLMHTFVIENALGEPVLENPDFRMKYLLATSNTKEIRSPIYLYKYGSSVYVDGGDEGTIRLSSENVDTKSFTTRTPILGIMPKEKILNSDGVPRVNFKKIYPTTLTVSSNKAARIDFEEIKGSPQGVHFNYSASLHMNGRHPKSRKLTFMYSTGTPPSKISVVGLNLKENSTVFTSQGGNRILSGPQFKVSYANQSSTITIDTTDNNYQHTFDGVQVGDAISINGVNETCYAKSFVNAGGTSSFSSTGAVQVILDKAIENGTETTSTYINTATVSHQINLDEVGSHVIADGVYGTYIADQSGTINKRGRDNFNQNPYERVEATATNSKKRTGSIISVEDRDLVFDAHLSNNRAIVASKTPIFTDNFKIHFLNPTSIDPIEDGSTPHPYDYQHWAEFGIGITPYEPKDTTQRSDSDPELKFEFTGDGGLEYKEFDPTEFPYVEFSHADVKFDHRNDYEYGEYDPLYGNRFEIDPRLDRNAENRIDGLDKGNVCTIVGKVTVNDFPYHSVESESVFFEGASRIQINFPTAFSPPQGIIPNQSELGRNFGGTGVKFVSDFIEDTIREEIGSFIYVEYDASLLNELASASEDDRILQTKTLTLKDDWKAFSIDEFGNRQNEHKSFSSIKAVSFNTQPLYPVFALGDYAKINGIVIEEILEMGDVRTHTPDFALETHTGHNITIANSNTGTHLGQLHAYNVPPTSAPSSFNSNDRLSASRYDKSTQLSNSLRPGNVLYSAYVGQNETLSIGLDNIFSRDRKSITRGSLNNKAVYITATSLDGQAGNLELSVTNREQ